jgi:hypothetical protein
MFAQRFSALLILAWFLLPAVARGQTSEAHDVEVIKPPRVGPSKTEKKPDLARAVKIIIDRTNEFRKEQGRATVESSTRLTRAAEYFAGYMAKNDRYGHGADGQRPADRARKHGYNYCIIAENIAYDYNSAGFTTEGWETYRHERGESDARVYCLPARLEPDQPGPRAGLARKDGRGTPPRRQPRAGL